MFNIKPHKEKLDPSLKQMSWEEAVNMQIKQVQQNLDLTITVLKMVTSTAKSRRN